MRGSVGGVADRTMEAGQLFAGAGLRECGSEGSGQRAAGRRGGGGAGLAAAGGGGGEPVHVGRGAAGEHAATAVTRSAGGGWERRREDVTSTRSSGCAAAAGGAWSYAEARRVEQVQHWRPPLQLGRGAPSCLAGPGRVPRLSGGAVTAEPQIQPDGR